jgi:SET domain-containing protein
MFRIATYLAPSNIHGLGVFTAEDVPAGTTIWEFTEGVDWRIEAHELAAFPEPYQAMLRHYCYRAPAGTYVLCGDNAKFMNHSDQPNCDDPEGPRTVANRDLEPGEELTCDYRTFDADSAAVGGPALARAGA